MLNSIKKLGFIVLLTLFASLNVHRRRGIALGATRVIYPSAAKRATLAISNSDTQERYLVNSYGSKIAPGRRKTFIVTPYSSAAQKRRAGLRGQPLPGIGVVILDERESHSSRSIKSY